LGQSVLLAHGCNRCPDSVATLMGQGGGCHDRQTTNPKTPASTVQAHRRCPHRIRGRMTPSRTPDEFSASPRCCLNTAHLSGEGVSPGNFLFHLVFFPAAYIFSGEGFSMVAVVPGITAIRRRVVNLLPYPSLIRCDWRSAMSALVVHARDHFLLLLDDIR
jgi:hypothetical protein